MLGRVAAPDTDELDVHEWIAMTIRDGIDESDGSARSRISTVCSEAVDPLEVAAALEVAGLSHAVVTERYERADVFSLARALWSAVPFRVRSETTAPVAASGGIVDLARGLLYIAPAVMLLAFTSTADRPLESWVLPFAISWGWGLGQLAAFLGYRVQGRVDPRRLAVVNGRCLIAAVVSTGALATVAADLFGGEGSSVVAATALVTFMVASAVLLVKGEELWSAVLLAPGVVIAVVVLVGGDEVITGSTARVVIAASAAAVAVRALRHVRIRRLRSRSLQRLDLLHAAGHLVRGCLCGIAASVVIIGIDPLSSDDTVSRALLSSPLLVTLGVMEWQLRTFRAGALRLLQSDRSTDEFAGLVSKTSSRSIGLYVTSISIAALGVAAVIHARTGEWVLGALFAQVLLGTVFFLELILLALNQLRVVLRGWLVAVLVAAALVGLSSLVVPLDRLLIVVLSLVAALASLAAAARAAVAIVTNH